MSRALNGDRGFAHNVVATTVGYVLVALGRVFLIRVLVRGLGTGPYGLWAQSQTTVTLLLGVLGLGLPYALCRFIASESDPAQRRDDFWSALTIVAGASGAVVVAILSAPQLLAAPFFDGDTDVVRVTALIALFWSLDTVFLSLYRATRRMVRYATLSVAEAYTEIVLSVVLIRFGLELTQILLAVAAVQAAFLVFFLAMGVNETGISLPRFRRMRQYLRFGIPTILSNLAAWVVSSSSRYALGYFSGAASVGIYAAAYTIGAMALPVAAVLGIVLSPTLALSYDAGRLTEVRKYLVYSLKMVLLANVPFVVGAAALGKEVLAAFTTPELASAGWPIVPLTAFAILLCSLHAVLAENLVVAKRTRTAAAIWLAAAGINIAANVVFVPFLGGMGAALAGIIGFGTGLCLTYFCSRGVTRPSVEPGFLAKLLAASGAMWVVAHMLQPKTPAATAAAVVLSIAVYVAGLAIMRVFSRDELSLLRGLLRRHARRV